MNRDRLRHVGLNLQAWVTISALVAAVAIVYAVFIASPSGTREGVALLPAPSCPEGAVGRPGKLKNRYGSAQVVIRYTEKQGDCNSLSGVYARDSGGVLTDAYEQVRAYGLRPVATPVEVALLPAPRRGPIQTFPSPGKRGAMILDPTAPDITLLALRGFSELSLAESAPGLTGASRRRLGFAVALLASGNRELVTSVATAVRRGAATDAATGIYEAWLVARLGPDFYRAALNRCSRACQWPQARDEALRDAGRKPDKLKRAFLARADGSAGLAAALDTP